MRPRQRGAHCHFRAWRYRALQSECRRVHPSARRDSLATLPSRSCPRPTPTSPQAHRRPRQRCTNKSMVCSSCALPHPSRQPHPSTQSCPAQRHPSYSPFPFPLPLDTQPCKIRWAILSRTVEKACNNKHKNKNINISTQRTSGRWRRWGSEEREGPGLTAMRVCSLIVISLRLTPASGLGRETREAIAIGSVSRIMLRVAT